MNNPISQLQRHVDLVVFVIMYLHIYIKILLSFKLKISTSSESPWLPKTMTLDNLIGIFI